MLLKGSHPATAGLFFSRWPENSRVKKLKKAKPKGQNSRKIGKTQQKIRKNPGKIRKMNQNHLETQEKSGKNSIHRQFFCSQLQNIDHKISLRYWV